jgi:hypothetical protein
MPLKAGMYEPKFPDQVERYMSEGGRRIGVGNKNARGQNGCSVFGRFCLPDSGRRYWKTRVSDRVASLRSIPQQGSQLLSASQVPCEELSLRLPRASSALSNAECAEDVI